MKILNVNGVKHVKHINMFSPLTFGFSTRRHSRRSSSIAAQPRGTPTRALVRLRYNACVWHETESNKQQLLDTQK